MMRVIRRLCTKTCSSTELVERTLKVVWDIELRLVLVSTQKREGDKILSFNRFP